MAYKLNTEKTWSQTYGELGRCFQTWGVAEWQASPNTTPNRVNMRGYNSAENAVTVRWKKGEREVTVALDTQDSPAANLRALYLCIDAMRLLEVRGVGQVAANAYRQLAGPQEPVERDPWEVLGLRPDADADLIESSYKTLAKKRHPDMPGGSEAAMAELNRARARALGEAVPA